MINISAETWNKAGVAAIRIYENENVNKTRQLFLCIAETGKGSGCKDIYDLIDKEMKGIYRVKKMSELTKQQIRKYKTNGSRLIKGSKDSMYVHGVILIPIIMQSRMSTPKMMKFRSGLGFNHINLILKKKSISNNTATKSIFCRKNKAAVQRLRKRKNKN